MDIGLEMIGVYVTCCHNTVTQYIPTYQIFNIKLEEEQRPGSPLLLGWWEQAGISFGNGEKAEAEGGELELG